jgi:hypothetical protein
MRLQAPIAVLILVAASPACAQSPPVPYDLDFGFMLRGGIIQFNWPLLSGSEPVVWDDFHLSGFRPENGVSTGPRYDATFDPATQLFYWDSFETPFGYYQWTVRATNEYGSDTGTFQVYVLSPEPSSALIAAIVLAAISIVSRRRYRPF